MLSQFVNSINNSGLIRKADLQGLAMRRTPSSQYRNLREYSDSNNPWDPASSSSSLTSDWDDPNSAPQQHPGLREMIASKKAGSSVGTGSTTSPKLITSLPPDLVIRIFSYLHVSDLPKVACVSRRFKILVYNDAVYAPKLKALGYVIEGPDTQAALGQTKSDDLVDILNSRLRQLPGGQFLPGSTRYLETGTMWGGIAAPSGDGSSSAAAAVSSNEPLPTNPPEIAIEQPAREGTPAPVSPGGATPSQKITSTLPSKPSPITVGAGGLRAKSRNSSNITIGMRRSTSGVASGVSSVSSIVDGSARASRESFKQIYTELLPYFIDFRKKQKDSKLFKDFKDITDVATILRRLRLFSRAKFLPNCDDIDFSLETTIEWFESMVLAQFDRAYDTKSYEEMRQNAMACFNLNGGASCVSLFVAKNPIFFDSTFNPSLINEAARLQVNGIKASGYALADNFASFMDHLLSNSHEQILVISKVFLPQMDAGTIFITKVFEDSVSEYLNSTLVAARDGESTGIYLHTLAATVHCCSQYVEFISSNAHGVALQTDNLKLAVAAMFKPYAETYINQEIDYMLKAFEGEFMRWKNRKSKAGKPTSDPSYMTDVEQSVAHKRHVMQTFKTVLFAPVALTMTIGTTIGSTVLGKKSAQPQSATTPVAEVTDDGKVRSVTYHLDDGSLSRLVSLELSLNLIHFNKESLGRAMVITAATDYSKLRINIEKIFVRLLKALGEKHLKPGFVAATDQLTMVVDGKTQSGATDSMEFFELVHIGDLISQMVDAYYCEDIKPWIDEGDFLSEIIMEKKAFERLLDDQVAGGMDKSIQALINQADHILITEQLPTDFNPVGGLVELRPTKACEHVVECFNAYAKALNGVTEKHTVEVFFSELAVRLFAVIIKHIKRHQVSQSGSIQLMCDLNRYYEWSTSLRVSSVSKVFIVLKELGNLFMADGEVELKTLVYDSSRWGNNLRLEEIYELLASRTDYKKIQKYVESKDCCIQ
ncbi:exocyst complex component Sec10-domain-containing protein [Polychytrium aggregatum]|uniref:exocyst complex component Sec10-domain-containing protein n=1 Tax=Polychytrium aggregatum TaxID=110093 RepID=UPI0022FE132C|nr:exocyst complex component Sec10-domain-containing protein [Polychytrium aggregatum]KAI9208175.1 exocyst complex component Sec10-domain-containing protein [Polychytrium aggregatum]